MADGLLSDPITQLLEKTLRWRSLNHQVIAGNLANLETPSYRRKEVNFADILQAELQGGAKVSLAKTHPRHLPGSPQEAGLVQETGLPVELDQEMVELSLNHLGYQSSLSMLRRKLEQLRTAIEGVRT